MRKIGIVALCLLAIYGLARAADVENPFRPPATTCTSQFIRSLAAITGVGTCATVVNADLATMTSATFKGQTNGGSGVPVDLTATQAAANIATVGGAIKTKVLSITRDLTVATGSVAYTGMGFTPLACAATGTVSGTALTQYTNIASFVDSSLTAGGLVVLASQTALETSFLTFTDVTAANSQNASVTSFDADGLTLSWTKTGTPTGTATIKLLCFR